MDQKKAMLHIKLGTGVSAQRNRPKVKMTVEQGDTPNMGILGYSCPAKKPTKGYMTIAYKMKSAPTIGIQ
jgi:hypothetical protein